MSRHEQRDARRRPLRPRRSIASLDRTRGIADRRAAVALVPLALASGDRYWLNILAYTYLFAGLAVAWNIIGGFGGQFSLGHGVFFAIGAYMTARLLPRSRRVSPWLG